MTRRDHFEVLAGLSLRWVTASNAITRCATKIDYSGKSFALATESEISLFRAIAQSTDARVNTISGILVRYDWHVFYLLLILGIECAIFRAVASAGLYISGGREAL